MTSVKQLMAKFSKEKSTVLTPSGFEEQKKSARQKELDEIRSAREKARRYNATLRAKSIQLAKEQSSQSVRLRAGLMSPIGNLAGLGGSLRSFQRQDTRNPHFDEECGTEDDETQGCTSEENDGGMQQKPSLVKIASSRSTTKPPTPTNSICSVNRAPSMREITPENPDNVPVSSLPSSNPASKQSPPIRTVNRASSPKNQTARPVSVSNLGPTLPTMPENHTQEGTTSTGGMFPLVGSQSSLLNSTRDIHSRASSMTSTQGIPEGGYDEIHDMVRFNRPSVSDLLLKPPATQDQPIGRNPSMSEVGPIVEQPKEEPSRLREGVEVRTVLHTFYQTYSPEKLDDLDLVLEHFKGRTEALLFTLECKYFVNISPDGLVTPYRPCEAPAEAEQVEDERMAARRGTMQSVATEFTDLTTDSYKGYVPSDSRDGGLSPTLAQSWAVKSRHDSGRQGRKPAVMMKKGA